MIFASRFCKLDQPREKTEEVLLQFSVVLIELADSRRQGVFTRQSAGKPPQCAIDSFTRAVGGQPVFRHHVRQHAPEALGQNRLVCREYAVSRLAEMLQGLARKPCPMSGQKVVVVNIDENSRVAAVRRLQPVPAACKQLVRVGEAVDFVVKPDALPDRFGILCAVNAPKKIAEQVSDQGLIRAVGKEKVCQIVHLRRG